MDSVQLVQQLRLQVEEIDCLIEVFIRPNGTHFAKTAFSADDVIINEGESCEEALRRHRELLPLAIHSRHMRRMTDSSRSLP